MRLGIVPFLNLKPLIGLYERMENPPVTLVREVPSRLYPLLESRSLDASFIASADYMRHRANLHLLSRYGVATRGSVASVLLLCRKPLESIGEIVADERSSTSVAMLRVLLQHKFHLPIPLTSGDIHSASGAEAILVIGDRALQCFSGYEHVYDIGTEWTEWSGLPFIFGVWVARNKEDLPALDHLLETGYRWTQQHWEKLIRQESRRTGLAPSLVEVYLKEHILYELTPREFEGLEYFWSLHEQVESETGTRKSTR